MQRDLESIKSVVRTRVQQLAAALGNDASSLADEELIPMLGILDSAAIVELIVWYEKFLGKAIPQEDVNIDNFGSVQAMGEYGMAKAAS
jgi:D-alanine--poly(phosphoribitol) ligase subunit 2